MVTSIITFEWYIFKKDQSCSLKLMLLWQMVRTNLASYMSMSNWNGTMNNNISVQHWAKNKDCTMQFIRTTIQYLEIFVFSWLIYLDKLKHIWLPRNLWCYWRSPPIARIWLRGACDIWQESALFSSPMH